jgi:thiol-disulfide isomerase/thioredoxin
MKFNKIIVLGMAVLAVSFGVFAAKNGNGNGNGNGDNGHNGGGHGFVCDDVKSASELKLDSNKPTVIVFYSQTCPSCADIKEPFNAFVKKYKSDINCAAIDVNGGARGIAQTLKITQVPTTVVIHKRIGATSAEKLESYLRQVTGMPSSGQGNGGTSIVVSKVVPTKTVDGKVIPMDDMDDEDDYLKPTDKALQVNPEDIEVLYEEDDISKKSPKFDDEIGMDMIITDTNKRRGDVMP